HRHVGHENSDCIHGFLRRSLSCWGLHRGTSPSRSPLSRLALINAGPRGEVELEATRPAHAQRRSTALAVRIASVLVLLGKLRDSGQVCWSERSTPNGLRLSSNYGRAGKSCERRQQCPILKMDSWNTENSLGRTNHFC